MSVASARPSARARPHSVGGARTVARFADAFLAIALFFTLELYVVGLARLREFAGVYELSLARNELLPVAFAIAAPLALASGCLVELASRGEAKGARATLAIAALLAGAAVAWGVAGGRAFEGGKRAPFAAVLGLASAALAWALAPVLSRAMRSATDARARWRLALAGALGVLAIELVDAFVLPRLYPAFHLALAASAIVLAGALGGALSLRPDRAPDDGGGSHLAFARAGLAGILAVGAFAATPSAAKKLALHDNLRIIYVEHAPTLARVVEIASMIAPPAPLEDAPLAPDPKSGHAIDWSGRDIVLVTIDALRADHVGAYGYARSTTPNIDALAKDGALFEAAYSPAPHTSYAVTSLMTGKYMRPLLLQDLGQDSETFASHLRRYGYRTAAFYPPAVFFIDPDRFTSFKERGLDFEYRRVEFLPAKERADQVRAYLEKVGPSKRVFLWVHLFEPHEPYEAHAAHPFGDRDVDRYDSEIAEADEALGAIVATVRAARPSAIVVTTADHGEEFDDHGGRYHGTTVYEEQVRVPLVVNAPGLLKAERIKAPVQIIDLLPTVLASLSIPRPARVRGADLGPLLAGTAPPDAPGMAFAETEQQTMLARGSLRLVCARKIGACALYDVAEDPTEKHDIAADRAGDVTSMRAELRALEASHGRYEREGMRREGKGWPEAIRRGLAGDGDAATDVAPLLDDADVAVRRKAAEVLFELARPESAPELRLAIVRDEDEAVRKWCALALTRLGEGAPRARDLLAGSDPAFRRLAALALAEGGDKAGEDALVAWLREAIATKGGASSVSFERAREIVVALGKIRSKNAVPALIDVLDDLRLRPFVARALAAIGQEAARPALAEHLAKERAETSRVALVEALVALQHKGCPELRDPLVRFLGTPDPLPNGLAYAERADLLELVGGPRKKDLDRIRRFATSGVAIGVIVPESPAESTGEGRGLRVVCRAKSTDGQPGELRFGPRADLPSKRDRDAFVPGRTPAIDRAASVVLRVPGGDEVEAYATLPSSVSVKPGAFGDFVVYATQNVALDACVVVPLSDELPPPPPEPWTPSDSDGDPQ